MWRVAGFKGREVTEAGVKGIGSGGSDRPMMEYTSIPVLQSTARRGKRDYSLYMVDA